jgi:hypothetical protein
VVFAMTVTEVPYLFTVDQRGEEYVRPEVLTSCPRVFLAHGFPDLLVAVRINLLQMERFGWARTWNARRVDVCSAPNAAVHTSGTVSPKRSFEGAAANG